MKRRVFSLLVALAMVLAMVPVQAAGGSFTLAVVTQDQVVVEPEAVAYTAGQTLGQALLASNHTFTGLEQGFVQAVDGVAASYYLYYDDGGFSLDVPASSVTGVLLTSRDGGWNPPQQELLVYLGQYRQMDSGVQNYPAAQGAYAAALTVLQQGGDAGEAQANLQAAVAEFQALMDGEKATVTFRITQGEGQVNQARLILTGPYGDVHTAQGSTIDVIPGSYRFVVSDGGDNRTQGQVEVPAGGTEVSVTLPSGNWFAGVELRNGDGQAYAGQETGTNRKTVYLPDTTGGGDVFIYAQRGQVPDAQTTRLYGAYTGTNGRDYSQTVKPWGSAAASLTYVVEAGMTGRTVELEARYPDGEQTQIQRYTLDLVRVPTLSALQVQADGVTLPLDFDPETLSYAVATTASTVTVTATAFGSSGYRVQVNGGGATAQVPVGQVNVLVEHDSGQSRTYVIQLEKRTPATVTVRYSGSLALYNAAGAVVPADTAGQGVATYRLTPGEAYAYVTTAGEYYHATAGFTAADGLTVEAAAPRQEDWLASLQAANGITAQKLQDDPYLPEPAFSPGVHVYRFPVSDCNSAFGLWVTTAAEDITVTATYTRLSTGQQESRSVTPGKATGASLGGLLEVTGYANQAVVRAEQVDNGVTYYQEYILAVSRNLHAYDLGLTVEGETVVLDGGGGTGFDRDVTAYTAGIPQGAGTATLTLTFPKTKEGEATYGGYTATVSLEGQTETLPFQYDTAIPVTLTLDTAKPQQTIVVDMIHADPTAAAARYEIRLEKLAPVTARFQVTPQAGVVNLIDVATGRRAWPDEAGSYALLQGHTYAYTVTCPGYVAQTGQFLADRDRTVTVTMPAAPENDTLPVDMISTWPDFRGNLENNAVVDDPLPIRDEEAVLYWATRLGQDYGSGAVGSPILADGYLYTYAGTKIYKIDTLSGQILAQGEMARSSAFAINAPTYAGGMIFVGLSNGGVQAFNAETLESLWLYNDPLGGQPNCSITYAGGRIYTGFWNGETMAANFVCLTVTDEDPTQPLEEKQAAWVHTAAGGYYWAGACFRDGYLVLGTDDGAPGYTIGYGQILCLDAVTGKVMDSLTLPYPGDVRCAVVYDSNTDAYYFTSKGGYFYRIRLQDGGSFLPGSLEALALSNGTGSATTPAMSTSTPVIYHGRAYIGVCGQEQFGLYGGHSIAVLDLQAWSVAYTVPTQGYPQTSGLLTTAYAGDAVYVYFFDNYTPGKLRVLEDRPGQTAPSLLTTETYTKDGKTETVDAAYVLFTPSGGQAQYAICSPISDETGTIYFKNDSGYLMALGSTITALEITRLPDKLRYQPGEVFDPTGMVVTAVYANGVSRDVTDYVTYSQEPLTQVDTELQIRLEHVLYQNAGGQSGVSYAAPMTAIDLRFGQATADEQAAEAVEALISALVFPVTEEGRPEIEAARAAYDSLTPAQQALVRNLHVLEQAEAELNRHAHDFGPWIANGDGTHSRACACGETEIQTCACKTQVLQPAACVESGSQVLVCQVCAWQSAPEALPALGHDFGPWVTDRAPDCFAEGSRQRQCRRCGQTETETLPASPENCPSLAFTDLRTSAWYHAGVDYVLSSGLMNGVSATRFSPDRPMTRGQLVTVLYRMEGSPAAAGGSPFSDVTLDQYYAQAVLWAAETGLVNGVGGGRFAPESNITREQIGVIFCRYAQWKGQDCSGAASLAGFADGGKVSGYARQAMAWAVYSGLMVGMEDNTLRPQGTATRAQVATMLMRYFTQ